MTQAQTEQQIEHGLVERLEALLLQQTETTCPVFIHYEMDSATAQIRLGEHVNAMLDDESLTKLRKELGEDSVNIRY